MNPSIPAAFVVGMLSLAFLAETPAQSTAPAKSNIPAAFKSQAKIPVETARATALKKVPGVVREEELEKENGKLVYSFDIQVTGQKGVTEVQVSAIDGSIVSMEKEDAASESKEKKQEGAKPKS